MAKTDYTVMNEVEVSFEERKSLFICNIKSINNEEEAHNYIAKIKQQYKDASHNVYAYITNNGISMRYSDDGEPQGTAGPPVLEVLKREELNDVVAVVTRYFGGILLGAGGLVRAYASSCKQGIDAAKKVKRIAGCLLQIECDYDKYGKINNYFQNLNVLMQGNDFFENVVMRVVCLEAELTDIRKDLMNLMNGVDIIKNATSTLCFIGDDGKILEG